MNKDLLNGTSNPIADDARKIGKLTVSEPFEARVKGVAEPLSLVRLAISKK